MKLSLLLIFVIIISCTSSFTKEIKSVYENRAEVLSIFNKVSIFRKSTGNNVFVYTYKGDVKNEYVFTVNQGNYSLFRDSLLFSPDLILGVNKDDQNSAVYRNRLNDKLKFYLNKMDSLKISDIDCEFYNQGIDLKIYMKSKGVLLYTSNDKSIVNTEWRKYIESMQKLDDNWYYTMSDK